MSKRACYVVVVCDISGVKGLTGGQLMNCLRNCPVLCVICYQLYRSNCPMRLSRPSCMTQRLRGVWSDGFCLMNAWAQDLTRSCQRREMLPVCTSVCKRRSDRQVEARWGRIMSSLKYYHMLLALYHYSLGWWLAGESGQPDGKKERGGPEEGKEPDCGESNYKEGS